VALKFFCTLCNIELITEFLSRGETAKCRNCGALVKVPDDAVEIDRKSSLLFVASPEPSAAKEKEEEDILDFSPILKETWKVIKDNRGTSIVTLAVFIILMAMGEISQAISTKFWPNFAPFTVLLCCVTFTAYTFARICLIQVSLGYAFKKTAKINELEITLKQFIRFFVVELLFCLLIIIGLVLLIVPGIIWGQKYQFAELFILKYNCGIIESFKKSSQLTSGYKSSLFGYNVIGIFFSLLGIFACCIGILITAPIATACWVNAFSRLIKKKDFNVFPDTDKEFFCINCGGKIIVNNNALGKTSCPNCGKEVAIPESICLIESKDTGGISSVTQQKTFPTICHAIVLIVGMLFLALFLFSIVFFISTLTSTKLYDNTFIEFLVLLISSSTIIFIGYKLSKRHFRDAFALRSFDYKVIIPLLLLITGLSIVFSDLDNAIKLLFPILQHSDETPDSFINILLIGIVSVTFSEEFIFRGLFLQGFLKNYTPKKAIIVTSLLYSLLTLISPSQFIGTFIIGVILGWIVYKTNSLWPTIIAQAAANSVLLFSSAIGISGIYHYEEIYTVVLQPWWFDLTGLALASIGFFWLYKIFNNSTPATITNSAIQP